ncbi:putative cysteine-rich receptor-like protein kinase 30 [Gossypium raimondii]|uniref:putative cysteine-rich receptor-like protein kinase 30 n=1 Tax=Gossypium raimondii TaxID=29730 RepID=UPI00227AAD97|nr:putative cysteine-rich receptor-like protein kinase 30 [Gossypium raimondii]
MWVNVLVFLLTHLLTGMSIIFNQDYVCITESGSFTTNSTYGKNLDHILNSLPDNVSKSGGFFTATAGQDSNKAYALGLCSGDLNPHDCYGLVKSAVPDLRDKCPDQKEAISWSGDPACIVRYANRPFFGILELEPTTAGTITHDIGSNLRRFDTIWESLTDGLVRNASNGSSSRKYATAEAYFTVSQNIDAQMQCTPDISQEECDSCLRAAKSSFKECCHGKQGGYVQKPNCMFTFDLIPTSTQDQKPEENQNKSIWVPLGESLSAILGLALVSACGIFLWKRTNIQGDKEDSQEVQLLDLVIGSRNHKNSSENVETSQEFPSIKLDILQAATTNFCDEIKLGQGGFGPVYKGTLADGNEIAVKRLSRASSQGLLEFKNEVMLIAKLQHRNLVRLLGCCLEKNEKLLVYEFLPNRSLDLFLFGLSLKPLNNDIFLYT